MNSERQKETESRQTLPFVVVAAAVVPIPIPHTGRALPRPQASLDV